MEDIIQELKALANTAYMKLLQFLKGVSPATLQLTGYSLKIQMIILPVGLLGIAAVLVGIYHYRSLRRRNRGNREPNRFQRDTSTQASRNIADSGLKGIGSESAPVALSDLRSCLQGIKTVTVSAPGVLFEEWDPEKFEESATVRPDAAEIIKEMAAGIHIYILAHVEDDIAEAVIRAALESARILGTERRQVPPHRLIFCEKLRGKVALVRQIEPQLHIDGSSETLEELQRFIPNLYQVVRKGSSPAACKTGLIACGPSLADAMNVKVFN